MRTINISFNIQIPDEIEYTDDELDSYLNFEYGYRCFCQKELLERFRAVDDGPVYGTFDWS